MHFFYPMWNSTHMGGFVSLELLVVFSGVGIWCLTSEPTWCTKIWRPDQLWHRFNVLAAIVFWNFAGRWNWRLAVQFYLAFFGGGGTTYVQQPTASRMWMFQNFKMKKIDISKTSSRFESSWSLTVSITGCLGESAIAFEMCHECARIHGSRWIWESGMHVAVSIWESGECCDCHVKKKA